MHAARFTRFCDRGDIGANCWCAGGRDAAAIGDASWLWQHFAGAPCAALDGDRCDCTACGGAFDDCPHEGCWQCLGVRPPRCSPPAGLRGCEVHVFGPRGNGTLEVTEACPSAHPCNRCKGARNPCASYDPLHVDVCGLRWADFFSPSEGEAEALVTLSCFGASRASAVPPPPPGCASAHDDDVGSAVCEAWCSADYADEHCSYCKCRACGFCGGGGAAGGRRTPVAATALVGAVVVGLAVALLGRRCQRVAEPVVAKPASAAAAYDISVGTQLADAGARAPNYGTAGGRRPAGGYAQCS